MHDYQDLINIFNDCFFLEYNTQLVMSTVEPLYLPTGEGRPHNLLYFAHGYFASALHECAHWLIAGPERRKLEDFGYWYIPEGRTNDQQKLFQNVEVKPQALEWILSKAAKSSFHISLDNLSGSNFDTQAFKLAIYRQIELYCQKGLTKRMQTFRNALCKFYNTSLLLKIDDFDLNILS